jgi:4-methyl-5(b-hydroxyethyl)-thiazole monophosphate biosynthesis
MVHVLLATGFEEVEAITTIDILRRCGIEVEVLSVTGARMITGAHGISVNADGLIRKSTIAQSECIILPGGMPGVKNLQVSECLRKSTLAHFAEGKLLAAICAAPMILGAWGLLAGKRVTCYPGCESGLNGGKYLKKRVVKDENLITANGPGAASDFAFEIAAILRGEDVVKEVKKAMGF